MARERCKTLVGELGGTLLQEMPAVDEVRHAHACLAQEHTQHGMDTQAVRPSILSIQHDTSQTLTLFSVRCKARVDVRGLGLSMSGSLAHIFT